jgi:hypothetical protein
MAQPRLGRGWTEIGEAKRSPPPRSDGRSPADARRILLCEIPDPPALALELYWEASYTRSQCGSA